jgi:hypothetical protein
MRDSNFRILGELLWLKIDQFRIRIIAGSVAADTVVGVPCPSRVGMDQRRNLPKRFYSSTVLQRL